MVLFSDFTDSKGITTTCQTPITYVYVCINNTGSIDVVKFRLKRGVRVRNWDQGRTGYLTTKKDRQREEPRIVHNYNNRERVQT